MSQFPRTKELPSQSSQYWAKEKDRYLRQLLLKDYEESVERSVIVYFSQLDQQLNHRDPDDLSEIIEGLESKDVDLIIQTPGGYVDAVEKIISVLDSRLDSYRVLVPSWAKSGGTVIAMASNEILLGVNSELGPIDPQMFLPNIGQVPCEFAAKDPAVPVSVQLMASSAVDRMKVLAKRVAGKSMMRGKPEAEIDKLIEKLSSSTTYNSHGAVIDFHEAERVGLNVTWLDQESEHWKRAWLLYCCYDIDTKLRGYGKLIEGTKYSIARDRSS